MTYAPPYAPQPVVRRPPLSLQMKRAARRAGGIGFVLMTIGWALFATAMITGIVWAIVAAAAQRNADTARGLDQVIGFFGGVPAVVLVGILVLIGLLGAAAWLVGLFTSRGILHRSGHPHPWGVTWAGFGLALVASWIGQWISYALGQFVNLIAVLPYYSSDTRSSSDYSGLIIGYAAGGGVWIVISLALAAVAGALLWWAMAVAMRPSA